MSDAYVEPDVNISALARSLDVSPSQLFGWRRAAARGATEVAKRAAEEAVADRPKRVEIEVGGAVVRVTADIAEDDLRRLLRAVRQS
jgi:transposase